MRPKEPIDPQVPGGNSPVPIPPVEGAWTAMRQRLDVEMPVERKRRRGLWLFLLLLPLLLWWWIERGQGIERGQTTPIATSPTAASETHPAGPASGTHAGTTSKAAPSIPSKTDPLQQPRKDTSGLTRTAPGSPGSKQPDASSVLAHHQPIRQPGVSSIPPYHRTDIQPDERPHSLHNQAAHSHSRTIGHQTDQPNQSGDRSGQPTDQPVQSGDRSGRHVASAPVLPQTKPPGHELKAVPIDAQRATWGRSIALDAPPLNSRRKGAANAKRPKQQPPAPDIPKKPEARILFAAGLADNKSFPVGAQQAVDYNANLKKDIWFDYVPTPYFQYHPSRKIALQFGIQFNSPQYTEDVTIFRKAGPPISPGSLFTQDTAIVVRKLYYFNFPLTIYYSPVRNVQLGIGIQYSNLRNGVALQNNIIHFTGGGAGQRDTVQNSKFVSLKDDAPAYNNLKRSDWRGLFEVNYYWRKITLGLQYQESLGDYLHTPVDGSQGKDRNSSFNLYLRYNIWEKRIPEPPRQ